MKKNLKAKPIQGQMAALAATNCLWHDPAFWLGQLVAIIGSHPVSKQDAELYAAYVNSPDFEREAGLTLIEARDCLARLMRLQGQLHTNALQPPASPSADFIEQLKREADKLRGNGWTATRRKK